MSYNSLIADTDLVASYLLDDDAASTTIVADTGDNGVLAGGSNTQDLTLSGAEWRNKALGFVAANGDHITIDSASLEAAMSTTAAFAVSLWANTSQTTPEGHLVAFGTDSTDRWSLGIHSTTGDFGFRLFDNNVSGHVSGANPGGWVHLVADWDNATRRLYVNGIAQSGTQQISAPGASGDVMVATRTIGIGQYTGSLDEILFYSRSLSSAEVSELGAGPEPTYTSGATLAANGAYDVGTWTDPSNGTRTYEWVVVEADGTVVDSGTGATGTADLGATTGLLTLLVRATNDGGYDVGDFATRTSGYGSAGDGYYEVATVTAVAADGLYSSLYTELIGSVY